MMNVKNYATKFFKRVDKYYWIPIAILLLAIGYLFYNAAVNGQVVHRDIDLRGGKLLSVTTNMTYGQLTKLVSKYTNDFNIRTIGRSGLYIIELPQNVNESALLNAINPSDYSIETVGPTVGYMFWKQAEIAISVSFLLMAIVVFIMFKSAVPSGAVILSAISDVIITIAALDILGIRVSIAIIGALLMLIGYSVDTDVLLTTKVLKSTKSVVERIYEAFKTGIMTSGTSFAALLVMYIFSASPVIRGISITLVIGLVVDTINTWVMNAGIIKKWVEKKERI